MKTMYETYQVVRLPLKRLEKNDPSLLKRPMMTSMSSKKTTPEDSLHTWLIKMLETGDLKNSSNHLISMNYSGQLGHVPQSNEFLQSEENHSNKLSFQNQYVEESGVLNTLDLNRYLNTGVGIEVEVENSEPHNIPGWQIKRDESLRNDGAEFVTAFGSRLIDVPILLDRLFHSFDQTQNLEKTLWSFNERTSIHVHLDCRKLSMDEVKSLLMIYTIFEDSLFRIAGEDRKHNVFCVPLRYVAMSQVAKRTLPELIGGWKKYCAINLCCLMTFGTIEFRHMEGNNNKKRIAEWVFILAKMLDYCRMTTTDTVMKEISELKFVSQYHQFANKIFGSFANLIDIVPHEIDMAISDAKMFFHVKV